MRRFLIHQASTLRTISWNTLSIGVFFFIPMTLLLCAGLWASLSWTIRGDGPMFLYCGFLMDQHGMVPVRDFVTGNMLGAHIAFRWLYRVFGSTTAGIRIADISLLLLTMASLGRLLLPFGRRVALGAPLVFGLFHCFYLRTSSLEIENLAVLPIVLATLFATTWFARSPRCRWLMTGLACGTLFTLKPQLAIAALPLFAFLVMDDNSAQHFTVRHVIRKVLRVACWFGAGFCVPILWMLGYFLYYGVLKEFVTSAISHFLTRAGTNLWNRAMEPYERAPYLIQTTFSWRAWTHYLMAVGTVAGIGLVLLSPSISRRQRQLAFLFLGLQTAYMLYPVFESHFDGFHYYPFYLMCSIWIACCLRESATGSTFQTRLLALSLAAYCIGGLFYTNTVYIRNVPQELVAPTARIERISTWLTRRLRPEDTVQPIETGLCGITHAALAKRIKPATRVICAGGLYSHISDTQTQRLRRSFMEELSAARPRFIIQSIMDAEFPKGRDYSIRFTELDAFLARNYFLALETRDFTVWELTESPTAEEDKARRQLEVETQKSKETEEELTPYIRVAR